MTLSISDLGLNVSNYCACGGFRFGRLKKFPIGVNLNKIPRLR